MSQAKAPVVHQCDENMRLPGTWPHYRKCGRPIFEGGKCKIHCASASAARAKKSQAKYEAKQAASPYRQIERLRAERAELVEALQDAHVAMDLAWAGLGGRLLAEGPLDQSYAHSVTRQLDAARKASGILLAKLSGGAAP